MKRRNAAFSAIVAVLAAVAFMACSTSTSEKPNPSNNTTTVDKADLAAAITAANTLYAGTNVGTAAGEVSQTAKETFGTAIDTAEAVNDDTAATQADVDTALAALNAAVTTFNGAIVVEGTVNKTELTSAIATAVSTKTSHPVGTETGNVPQSAMNALDTAIAAATAVKDNADATQTEVNDAVTALNAAITAFEAEIIEAPVVDVSIDPADAMYLLNSDGSAGDFATSLANWDTWATINADFTEDATYGHALQAGNGTGWGTAVAFMGLDKGVFAEYTTLRFKLKTTQAQFKVQVAPKEVVMDPLSSSEYVTALEGDWMQVEIPLSAFGTDVLTAVQIGFYDHANCTFLLTDICLSGTPDTVNTAGLSAEITAATSLNDDHSVGTEDGNVTQDDKNALTDAISVAQALVDTPPSAQSDVTAAIQALADVVAAFKASILVLVPTDLPSAPTLDASDVISLHTSSNTYTNISGITWNPNWGQAGTLTDFTVSNKTVKKLELKSNGVFYQGVDFGGEHNITGKLHLHIDYLTFNGTNLAVSPISTGPQEYSIDAGTITADGAWHSMDITIDSTKNVDITKIIQIKFTSTSEEIFFLDNLYFY